MAISKMTADEKRWRAESDARILVDAETIRTEKARLGAAIKEINKMNKVKEKEIKLAKKVIKSKGKNPTTKPTKKPVKGSKTTRKTTRRKR